MAGQAATLPLSKARAFAKGAGCDYSPNEGSGTKATAPTEGRTLGGNQKGNSASAGDSYGKGKSKTKHSY